MKQRSLGRNLIKALREAIEHEKGNIKLRTTLRRLKQKPPRAGVHPTKVVKSKKQYTRKKKHKKEDYE